MGGLVCVLGGGGRSTCSPEGPFDLLLASIPRLAAAQGCTRKGKAD